MRWSFDGARGYLFLLKLLMLLFVMLLQIRDEVGRIKLPLFCATTGNLRMTSYSTTSLLDCKEKYFHMADISCPCYIHTLVVVVIT